MYIGIYKVGTEIVAFSSSDYAYQNPQDYLIAEVEGNISDMTDEECGDLVNHFSLVDGMLVSSKFKILSISINENYVEPTLPEPTQE
jgi:hypothetical protein